MRNALLVLTGAFNSSGGIASVNRLVIRAMALAGIKMDLFVLAEEDATIDDRYVSSSVANYRIFSGAKMNFTRAVWQALLKTRYNVVFSDHVNLASILAPWSVLRRCRPIVWVHGVEVFPPRPDFEGRIGLGASWKVLASSEYSAASVQARFPHLKVKTCDLALDPILNPPLMGRGNPVEHSGIWLRSVAGLRACLGSQVILHVGHMAAKNREKGQDCLLRAFPDVQSSFPEAQLVLAGSGEDYSSLLALARSLPPHAQTRVFMLGYVDQELLDALYRSCFLFAMPSVGEGFGLVYLEAMNRAKPCLGARVDATPYVIRDGETGLLVDDPRSPEQIAGKINWFLKNPDQAEEMGRSAQRIVQEYYSFSAFQERLWKAILE